MFILNCIVFYNIREKIKKNLNLYKWYNKIQIFLKMLCCLENGNIIVVFC